MLPSLFSLRTSKSNTSFSGFQSLPDSLSPSLSFSFLKNLIENESQSIQDYFKELRGILNCEERKELQRLEKEERDVLSYLAQGGSELTQQSQLLRDLIGDLQCRLQGSTAEMLQVRLRMNHQHLNLRKIKTKFPLMCGCAVSCGDTEVPLVL